MARRVTLEAYLAQRAGTRDASVAGVVQVVAEAAKDLGAVIATTGLPGIDLAALRGAVNADGDAQKELDCLAHDRFMQALARAPVAAVASEELDKPVVLDPAAPLAVAIDPLDGSSNIETNAPIGTIFSVLPAPNRVGQAGSFLRPGTGQLAAGFVIYGPQTALVLTLRDGVRIFVLDRAAGEFVLAMEDVRIPDQACEYAINASNYRHWDEPVRAYIDDCVRGLDGPRGKNFNMRWTASLVAEAYRILMRGGVFLYPRDQRPGYRSGRLRLVYEANPIALVVEQAGGAATDGERRILELVPDALHQRTPLVFGSRKKVENVARYHADPQSSAEHSPLFGRRGLLRV